MRKARGVWYTPHPVVSFQVRAIDEILKTESGIAQGITDSSKIKIKVNIQGKPVEQEVHRVQMLDPATGNATYLAEVISFIHEKYVFSNRFMIMKYPMKKANLLTLII